MTEPDLPADYLVIGSGIMGSIVARQIRAAEPSATIVMVDGGRPIGARGGVHLHDVAEREIWELYNSRVESGIQGFYAGAAPVLSTARGVSDLESGMHLLSTLGEHSGAMPNAAAAWNVGGMGSHWTAATPWPWGHEVFGEGEPWRADLETARTALGVTDPALGPTAVGDIVLRELQGLFAGRGPAERAPQTMPMAVQPSASGMLARTGPATIFPPIADGGAHFTLLAGTQATAIEHDGTRARGARLRDTATGAERFVAARAVVVCADTFRTPQLLFASGIRPPALGRYLNEHAFLTGRVLLDLERFGLTRADLPPVRDGEFATDSLWLPQNGAEQPFHGQIMNTTYVDDGGAALAHSVGLSLYTPVESRAENRVVFRDDDLDLTGMPRFSIEFSYSDADLALIEAARVEMARVAAAFGAFDPDTESALLLPGSSLHQTGTVRLGPVDDGTSVCDPDGRVWDFDNLFVAGNGVIPTAVVANTTLTGAVTAVRAARAARRVVAGAAAAPLV